MSETTNYYSTFIDRPIKDYHIKNNIRYTDNDFKNLKNDFRLDGVNGNAVSDPRVRSDMFDDLVKLRKTIQQKYPGGDFIVSSAGRATGAGGHYYKLAVDIKPTGNLTWSQLYETMYTDYKDAFHPVMHNNMAPGSNTPIKIYNPNNYNRQYQSTDDFHIDVKYKKYENYFKTKPDTPNNIPTSNLNFLSENTGSSSSTSFVNQANPQPQINPNLINLEYLKNLPTPTLGSLGSVILGSITNVGLSALSNFGVGKLLDRIPTGNIIKINSPYYGSPTIEYPAGMSHFHNGGEVPGQGEVLAILKGGETVRTKAQEEELQQNLYEQFAENSAPTVCGGDKNNQDNSQDSKKPFYQQLTKDDEMYILRLVADAIERNRCGLRHQIKAV